MKQLKTHFNPMAYLKLAFEKLFSSFFSMNCINSKGTDFEFTANNIVSKNFFFNLIRAH